MIQNHSLKFQRLSNNSDSIVLFNSKLIQRLNMGVPEFVFRSDQRRMDDRFIHMNYIADNIPKDVILSSKEYFFKILDLIAELAL